jgi:SP family general alpha glucoside:H+ symporter-like MFS transporter
MAPHTHIDPDTAVIVAENDHLAVDEKVISDAAKADDAEHNMSLWDVFQANKRAIFWSMALSAALIMEGYDVVVIGSYYGHREYFTYICCGDRILRY